jgi:DNA-binding transcriptional LysR family regulator
MDTRKLRYFARIVELGSISQASNDLHIAQPALSKTVLALESELQARLLIRSSQGVTPTNAGFRLYEHAQIILNQLDQARQDVMDASNSPSGQVRIGMPYSIAATILVPLIRVVRERFPEIQLKVFQEPSITLPDHILSGRLDIGVIVTPGNVGGLRHLPLVQEELLFVSTPQILKGFNKEISLVDISDLPLILPTRANSLRILIDSFFLLQSLPMNVVHEVEAISHFIGCVEAGVASTFLPAGCLGNSLKNHAIDVRSLVGRPLSRNVTLACSQSRPMGNAERHVEAQLCEVMKEAIDGGNWIGARWIG